MKATRHNGRSGKHGTYDTKHNDRRFDVENSEYMTQRGRNLMSSNMCRCPFHQDKTANMKVKPTDKKYFCFGCGEKGDAIDFVARYYNLSPKDAAM